MYDLLKSIIRKHQYKLDVVMEYPLHELCGTDSLSDGDTAFTRRSRVDFVLFDKVTKRPVLAIEVDGHGAHGAKTLKAHKQRGRDEKKNRILAISGMPLIRLPTTGSGEEEKINTKIKELLQNTIKS